MSRYSRKDVLRIMHLKNSQLLAWERAELVPLADEYDFNHLIKLQAVTKLRGLQLPAKKIRASVLAMRRIPGVSDPLMESSAVRMGSRVTFRYAGALLDPLTLQLAFDFAQSASQALNVPGLRLDDSLQAAGVQEIFARAVQLEENATSLDEAAELYGQILVIRPDHAPASINLGTIHYNRRDFARAEELYRNATVSDPDYALAFFDLGNVLDETMQLDEAIASYQRAVALVPQYADAHYNLALAYERQGERRRALRHWLVYARLDPIGPWASHAKGQARKILNNERLSIVSRRGQKVPIAG